MSMFRVLNPEVIFARLRLTGIELSALARRYLLPDGSERFLVNEQILRKYTIEFGELYEPIKTTNVMNMRCMTTWCVQKR